jgi:hypothetical protein
MKKALVVLLGLALLCVMAASANAGNNEQAKWALHYAGGHDAKNHTCTFAMSDCRTAPDGQMVVTGPAGPGRFDVYVLAIDTDSLAGTRYGLCCPEGSFFFYGWTKCSLLEIPTANWPDCGEGDAQTFGAAQPAGCVTLGILDVYVYPGPAKMCICNDPSSTPIANAWAQWCDASVPDPYCIKRDVNVTPIAFGCVGFGMEGFNPCGGVPTEKSSWGAVKSLYK